MQMPEPSPIAQAHTEEEEAGLIPCKTVSQTAIKVAAVTLPIRTKASAGAISPIGAKPKQSASPVASIPSLPVTFPRKNRTKIQNKPNQSIGRINGRY
jgi:hypothetical protein